jgi:multiple sugar transport system permease protein
VNSKVKIRPGRVFLYVVLTVGSLLMLSPFIWMVLTALKSPNEVGAFTWLPKEYHWENFVEAMKSAPILNYFRNSLIIAIGETAVTLAVCTMAGYALA